jgi:hypothetical protein
MEVGNTVCEAVLSRSSGPGRSGCGSLRRSLGSGPRTTRYGHGRTKSGDRCKRSAREGSSCCAIHAAQAEATPGEADATDQPSEERGTLDTLVLVAATGVVVVALLTVRRFFRIL